MIRFSNCGGLSRMGASTDLCLLCPASSENRAHFIADSLALIHARQSYFSEMESLLLAKNPPQLVESVLNDKTLFTQLVLKKKL